MTDSSTHIQTAELMWRDEALPISIRFDDPYFSLENGLAETRHVFLAGNDLPSRFREGFQIAELGFGTGLNMFASLLAWRAAGMKTPLHFTSFEAYPMSAKDMERALAAFPQAHAVAAPFLDEWAKGKHHIKTDDLVAEIIIGDARETVSRWRSCADAWFLDGFSPAKNPELWEQNLLADVASHTATNGTLATYTAAGFVRRNLASAGFKVDRITGFGRKRHMTVGHMA